MTQQPTTVSTTVTAPLRRSFTPAMFNDLLPAGGSLKDWGDSRGVWTLTFTAPAALSTGVKNAITDRMSSRDTADQQARTNLAALLAAMEANPLDATKQRALVVAVTRYLLDR